MRWIRTLGLSTVAAFAAFAVAQTAPSPSALDYGVPGNWVCRPDRPCLDDLTAVVLGPRGEAAERFKPAATPKIDCFYVYPTVSMSREQNAPPGVTEAERRAVRQQVARLASVCRLYVPFYRQFTAGGMLAHLPPDPARRQAGFRLAQDDVLAAWDRYLADDNRGRGVVLIGHSQGAGILQELIHRRIEGRPAEALLVSAVLPGSFVVAPEGRDVGGTFRILPACRRDGQTGCVIVFNSFRPDVLIDAKDVMRFKGGDQALCTNPAALAGGRGVLKPYLSATGETIIPALTETQPPWTNPPTTLDAPFVTLPGFYAAECRNDEHGVYLAIVATPQAGDRRTGALVGDWVQDGARNVTMGLHLIDLNLVMGNLIDVLQAQADAWCARPAAVCRDGPDVGARAQ